MPARVFICFAAEDKTYRDFLVGQMRLQDSPIDFIDFSVKEPWDEKWKTNCRTKIKGCEGFIALISKKTWYATGARWEMKCADEEGLPMIGVHIHADDKGAIPPELVGHKVIEWTWDGIKNFLNRL
jgi:hypothetical protein